jgi:hypothetical protein
MTTTLELLREAGACDDALCWAEDYPDPQSAWDACTDGHWMAWCLGRLAEMAGDGSPEHRRAVLVACRCARTDPRLSEPGAHALDLIEAWALGGEDRRGEAFTIAVNADDAAESAAVAALRVRNNANNCHNAASETADWASDAEAHLRALADLIRATVPVVPLPGGAP